MPSKPDAHQLKASMHGLINFLVSCGCRLLFKPGCGRHTWFPKIDPVRIVCMCVCICVCVSAPEAINN